MCGIEGSIAIDHQPIDRRWLVSANQRALSRISHRGPDQQGLHIDEDLVMGNTRLAIVGLDEGAQPVNDNNCQLVFNGEIYNHQSLDLGQGRKASDSDTRNLFHFLREHGVSRLNDLNGMFAFCFANERDVFLVRDRFGEKPLFYTIVNGQLFFASEIKALAEVRKLRLQVPDLYFHTESAQAPQTFFEDIFELEPGHYLQIDRSTKKMIKVRYYNPDLSQLSLSFKDAVVFLQSLLREAIRIRIPQDQDHAAYISGGLDSSIIALLSRPDLLLTFIAGTGEQYDESEYADAVATAVGKNENDYLRVSATHDQFMHHLFDLVYSLGAPTTSVAAFSQYLLAKTLQERGLRVVLSGIGADEFFAGYVRHALAMDTHFSLKRSGLSAYKPMLRKLKQAHAQPLDKYAALINRSKLHDPTLLKPSMAEVFDTYDVATAIALTDNLITLPPLLKMDDHLNMRFGIESRSPFLDHRIVEFGLKIPTRYKIHHTPDNILSLKHILRSAAKEVLPPVIAERKSKVGFPSSVNLWLADELHHLVRNSSKILTDVFPNESYFQVNQEDDPFDRRNYQLVQMAASYLIHDQGYFREEFAKELLAV